MKRTHRCDELRKEDINKDVILCGWVQSYRDHGGVIFIDLRDRKGLTQIVFEPSHNNSLHAIADTLRREWVIEIKGKVRARAEGMANPNLKTGDIEILADDLTILNKSKVPPIEIDDRKIAGEDLRLKYRYLDLRRPSMQKQLEFRHKVVQGFRSYFNNNDFIEIETPLLIRSTPEGARDYIVPSRVNPGEVYSLPQSPQLYKQILMISGFDRYYQIARCLRDEDLRADRQPEFTQVDFEMSFVEEEDIMSTMEDALKEVFNILKKKMPNIQKITYKEAIDKYGCDKPDLRFNLELIDITNIAEKSDFTIFKSVIEKGGIVKCLPVPEECSRKQIDRYTEFVSIYKVKGLAWMKMKDKLESSIVKFFSDELQKELIEKTGAKQGYTLFFVAERPKIVNDALSHLRKKIAQDYSMYDKNELKFCWVTDFPMFEFDEDLDDWTPAHHIFTMPKEPKKIESDPGKIIAKSFDLVLNGIELGSGSIRIHQPDIQEQVLNVIGITKEQAEERFGFLLEALKYGAPPHGGFAIGLDRLAALLQNIHDIREVIAFPKNKNASCPMDGSPSAISNKELKDVHLKWDIIKN